MSILVNEMGQELFSSLEANWHSTTFIFWLNSRLQRQSGCVQAVHWALSLACAASTALPENFLGKQYLQQAKDVLGLG